jgi:hypothetical protein
VELDSVRISAMWKDLLDKWQHNTFDEVLRIELVLRAHQIHGVETLYPHITVNVNFAVPIVGLVFVATSSRQTCHYAEFFISR